ncbi:MAG: hypothetical protein ABIQ18_43635 [Umezawaea sp.]
MNYADIHGKSLAASRTYQWFRNGVAVAGSVGPSYLVTSVDYGMPVTVKVTAKSGARVTVTSTVNAAPVAKGVFAGTFVSTVTLGSGFRLTASPSGLTAPTGAITYGYQWFRQTGSSAPLQLPGANTASYILTAADYGAKVYAIISASGPNYATQLTYSVPHSYSVLAAPTVPAVLGEQRIGIDLVVGPRSYVLDGTPVSPDVNYSWFRDGVAIPGTAGVGDTFRHYTPTAADAGKAITVTVTAASGAFQPAVATSLPTQRVAAFSIDGWDAPLPDVVQTPGTLKLTLPRTGMTDPAATIAYQWLRGGVAIAGATTSSYMLTAADTGQLVSVRMTASKALYTTIVKTSPGIDYSIRNTAPVSVPAISTTSAAWQVGARGQVDGLAFVTKDGPLTGATLTYQWLRNGVAIVGATGATYDLVAADLGARTTVRLTVGRAGYLPITVTSAASPVVIKGDLGGSFAAPGVSVSASNLLAAVLTPGTVTTPGVAYAYAWLRDGSSVIGTAAIYQMAGADLGHTISLRITASKLNYNNAILATSPAVDYSITADGAPVLSNGTHPGGTPRVGDDLSAVLPNYSTKDGPLSGPPGVITYQWFKKVATAAPLAIAGATSAHYIVASADVGATTTLSVRVTTSAATYLTLVQTSAQTAGIGTGVITGTHAAPIVSSSAAGLLSVGLTPGSIDMPSPVFSYQWFRVNGPTPVLLASTPTYLLTTANLGQQIFVRVAASKSNATPVSFVLYDTAPRDYGIVAAAAATLAFPDTPPRVGDVVSVALPSFTDTLTNPVFPTYTYQWSRKVGAGAFLPIAGAMGTGPTYTVVATDVAATLQVTVTASLPGLIKVVMPATAASPAVAPGVIAGASNAPVVVLTNGATNDYTATIPAGTITTPGVTPAYKWYRDGTAIAGQVAAVYRLVAADAGHVVSARISVSKAGYATRDLGQSIGADYGMAVTGFGLTVVNGNPLATGQFLAAGTAMAWQNAAGVPVPANATYQWYRKAGATAPVLIAGATQPTYELGSLDWNTTVSVIVTQRSPGLVSLVSTSTPTANVPAGDIQGGFTGAAVVPNGAGSVKVSVPAGFVTTSGVTTTYQWYRAVGGSSPVAIVGAVSPTYTLTVADQAAVISAVLTLKKANLTPAAGVTVTAAARDVAQPTLTGADMVGRVVTVGGAAYVDATGNPLATTATFAVAWFRQFGAAPVIPIARVTIAAPGYLGFLGATTVATDVVLRPLVKPPAASTTPA